MVWLWPVSMCIWWEDVRKTELDSSQWCLLTGWEATGTRWNGKFCLNTRRKRFGVWPPHWNGLPGRASCLELIRAWLIPSWATCCGWPCCKWGGGTQSAESQSTSAVVWYETSCRKIEQQTYKCLPTVDTLFGSAYFPVFPCNTERGMPMEVKYLLSFPCSPHLVDNEDSFAEGLVLYTKWQNHKYRPATRVDKQEELRKATLRSNKTTSWANKSTLRLAIINLV